MEARVRELASAMLGRFRGQRAQAGLVVVSGTGVGAVASFVAAIIAARALPIDAFAAFGVGIAVNSLTMQFGDLGLSTVAMAEAADARGGHEARARLVRLAVRRILSAVVSGALIAAAVVFIPSLEPYRDVALIAVGGGVLGCISIFTVGALQAFRRFGPAGGVQAVLGAARLVLVALAAIAGLGPEEMMVGYGVLPPLLATAYGLAVLVLHRRSELAEAQAGQAAGVPGVAIPTSGDVSRRRNIAAIAIFGALLLNGDVLLLSMIGSETEVATYSAAWRIAAGILILNASLASAILPFVLDSTDPWSEFRKLTRFGTAISAFWLLMALPITLVGVRVLGEVGDDATWPLLILLFAFSIDAFFFIVHQIYFRVRRERFLAILLLAELTMMVTVTLALRNEGALAPAIGQLAARIFICLAIVVPVLLQATGRLDWLRGATGGPSRQ